MKQKDIDAITEGWEKNQINFEDKWVDKFPLLQLFDPLNGQPLLVELFNKEGRNSVEAVVSTSGLAEIIRKYQPEDVVSVLPLPSSELVLSMMKNIPEGMQVSSNGLCIIPEVKELSTDCLLEGDDGYPLRWSYRKLERLGFTKEEVEGGLFVDGFPRVGIIGAKYGTALIKFMEAGFTKQQYLCIRGLLG